MPFPSNYKNMYSNPPTAEDLRPGLAVARRVLAEIEREKRLDRLVVDHNSRMSRYTAIYRLLEDSEVEFYARELRRCGNPHVEEKVSEFRRKRCKAFLGFMPHLRSDLAALDEQRAEGGHADFRRVLAEFLRCEYHICHLQLCCVLYWLRVPGAGARVRRHLDALARPFRAAVVVQMPLRTHTSN